MAESGSNPNPDEDQASVLRFPSNEAPASPVYHILVIEDNPSDVFLIREAIKESHISATVQIIADGEEAARFFDDADENAASPCPTLVILDINLPRRQGGYVLDHLRKSHRLGNTPVIVVSTSASANDQQRMIDLGANAYFHKPSVYADFMKLGDVVRSLLKPRS
jgi:CheY-like chemotaxis protein